MTTEENTAPAEGAPVPPDHRPLGAWLRLVDALITREFDAALDGEDVSRRDWMLLNALAGAVDAPWSAERLARRGKSLRRLAERGWIAEGPDGSWMLSDEGRAAQARLQERVQAVRTKVSGAVSPEEFAQLTASLQKIAEGLGWDESQPMPHRRRSGGRRGFNPRRSGGFGPWAHGFGPDLRGFDPGPRGFGPRGFGGRADAAEHRHGGPEHRDRECSPHGRSGGDRHGAHAHGSARGEHGNGEERAYERGFAAGFAARPDPGRSAAASADA